jgi:hypothetical protein
MHIWANLTNCAGVVWNGDDAGSVDRAGVEGDGGNEGGGVEYRLGIEDDRLLAALEVLVA